MTTLSKRARKYGDKCDRFREQDEPHPAPHGAIFGENND